VAKSNFCKGPGKEPNENNGPTNVVCDQISNIWPQKGQIGNPVWRTELWSTQSPWWNS